MKFKRKCVEYKGGKCMKCGYQKSIAGFDFHHRDENEKEFNVGGRGVIKFSEAVKKELDKCDILCACCHRELHEELDNAALAQLVEHFIGNEKVVDSTSTGGSTLRRISSSGRTPHL